MGELVPCRCRRRAACLRRLPPPPTASRVRTGTPLCAAVAVCAVLLRAPFSFGVGGCRRRPPCLWHLRGFLLSLTFFLFCWLSLLLLCSCLLKQGGRRGKGGVQCILVRHHLCIWWYRVCQGCVNSVNSSSSRRQQKAAAAAAAAAAAGEEETLLLCHQQCQLQSWLLLLTKGLRCRRCQAGASWCVQSETSVTHRHI